jgi:hypothetical protein
LGHSKPNERLENPVNLAFVWHRPTQTMILITAIAWEQIFKKGGILGVHSLHPGRG